MRLISWLRARYQAALALHKARQAEATNKRLAMLYGGLSARLDLIESQACEQARLNRERYHSLAGPLPESEGLSLAALRGQICELEQLVANARAALRTLRDAGDAQARRIGELETRLGDHETKFASRTDVLGQASLN